MWADVDTPNDFLNYSEIAEQVAGLVREKSLLPLSLGIFGGWGAGKSSMLRLVEQELLKGTETAPKEKFLLVEYDAWLYQDFDDARAALMETIATELIERAKGNQSLFEKTADLLRRVNWFRAVGTSVQVGASIALGIPPLGVLKRVGDAVVGLVDGNNEHFEIAEADLKELKEGGASAKKAAEKIAKDATGFLKPKASPPKEITAFRQEFGEILSELDVTLVVFIDNLDRCMPDKAINTLEAIRLFLFLPNTAFVIAADEDMIRHSVEKHYQGPMSRHVNDYLDKLIQVPVRVPRVGIQELQAYMTLLFLSAAGTAPEVVEKVRVVLCKGLRESWRGEQPLKEMAIAAAGTSASTLRVHFDLAEYLAPVLANAPEVDGNPRIVKRLLNTVRMRTNLARMHGMQVDEPLLAKLAVFERCTDTAAYTALCRIINDAAEGKPELFASMEENLDDPDKVLLGCPKEWEKHAPFISSWIALEPSIAGRDLRAAIYLSRETIPLRPSRAGMSAVAVEAFSVLMKCQRTNAPSAVRMTSQLQPQEQTQVMDMLLAELKKVTDWRTTVPGIHGAIVLANFAPSEAARLKIFIEQLPAPGKWLEVLLRSQTWAN